MGDRWSILDTVELALAEHDARQLPPLEVCLREQCTNSILSWLNPYYCSHDCERADQPPRLPAEHWEMHQGCDCRCVLEQLAVMPTLPDTNPGNVVGIDPSGDVVYTADADVTLFRRFLDHVMAQLALLLGVPVREAEPKGDR